MGRFSRQRYRTPDSLLHRSQNRRQPQKAPPGLPRSASCLTRFSAAMGGRGSLRPCAFGRRISWSVRVLPRIKGGFHRVVINCPASSLFGDTKEVKQRNKGVL